MQYQGNNDFNKLTKATTDLAYRVFLPPGEKIVISVTETRIWVEEDINGKEDSYPDEWFWASRYDEIVGVLDNLYSALKDFREGYVKESSAETCNSYLNNIDSEDLFNRLRKLKNNQVYDWDNLTDSSDSEHRNIWNKIKINPKLRNLAYYGRQLYEGCFPQTSKIRNSLDSLNSGALIKINWISTPKSKWRSHFPWGLMFQQPVPDLGEEVNPLYFWSLFYRIEYISHSPDKLDAALGCLEKTNRLHYLYWGETSPEICQEVQWQRDKLSSIVPNQQFVPNFSAKNRKSDLLQSLKIPTPPPVKLLYFYCFCDIEKGNKLKLLFGDDPEDSEQLFLPEISLEKLQDRPLVFANACTTLASDFDRANDFKRIFFQRGCAAYLGTEAEVPIILASRFAMIFFYFFYSPLNSQPVVAGEAVWRTRRFLWAHYKNIGGLFYSYVGLYKLHIKF